LKRLLVKNQWLIINALMLILSFWFPITTYAQKYPLELSVSRMEHVGIKSGVGNVDIEHDHASLILPVVPLESFMFLIYLKEDQRRLDYTGFSEDLVLDGSAVVVPPADFPEKLVNSTRGALLAIPIGDVTWVFRRDEILATDTKEVNADDRSFMNQILYRPKSNEKGRWFYGLSHLGGIAQDAFIPLLGYTYKGDVVRINTVLPSYFIIHFKLGEHGYVLIDETITAENYRLTEAAPWDNAYLSLMNLTSRLEAGIRFGDFEIGLSYGLVNIHSMTFNDQDHNELHKWKLDADTVTSLQLQLNL
jgi:hypothetical protein